ncbi:MAG: DUF6785 family protein [Desulfobacterales bacterium]
MENSEPGIEKRTPGAGTDLAARPVAGAREVPVRMRAVGIGFFLAMIICAITPFNNVYRAATPLGGGHFPLAPFYILFWLMLVTYGLKQVFSKFNVLTGRELLLIWILMVLASGIAYTGLVRAFFINLTLPQHFARLGSRWAEELLPLLPGGLYPQNPEAVSRLYDGLAGGRSMNWWQVFQQVPWGAWARPIAIWGLFICTCYFVMLCMINILSRQAIENERMNFPLLRVPQLMQEAYDDHALGRFLTDRFLLAGLMIPVTLHLINGLNFYIPSVPQIPTLILAGPYFPKYGLFSGFYKLKIYIYPAFIGFAFLTSKQISLSCWLFFIAGGFLFGLLAVMGYDIPEAALGITFGPTLSRPEETQTIGAYAVFFLFLFWLARYHLLNIVRDAVRLRRPGSSQAEWISSRLAFWGFLLGSAAIIGWCAYFGLPLLPAFFVVCAYFMVMLVASRVICQGGLAYFTLTNAPLDGLLFMFGPRFFGSIGLLISVTVQKMLFLDLRESLMPSLLHTGRVTYRMSPKKMIIGGIMATLLAAVAVSLAAMLILCYKFGIRELDLDWALRSTVSGYENVQALIDSPMRSGNWVLFFSLVGAVVMLVLVVCYHQFYWWPIHPIGYLTTYSSAMRILWFSFFVGWLFNVLCMRYGGVQLFKKMQLFFVGLIIGDFFMAGTWAIIGLFRNASYLVFPA